MSSFRFIIKQQWTIEEIYIFSNISHLERRADLSDTILKETHPRTIPARFGLIRFRGFKGEDLNVKVYDVRRTDWRWQTTDAKRWQKLTWPLTRWAKNLYTFHISKFWTCTLPFLYFSRYKTAKSLKNGKINQRLSRACIIHLVIKKNNWSYVKTMSCSGIHLGITINICNNIYSFSGEGIWTFSHRIQC